MFTDTPWQLSQEIYNAGDDKPVRTSLTGEPPAWGQAAAAAAAVGATCYLASCGSAVRMLRRSGASICQGHRNRSTTGLPCECIAGCG